jgi:hypothetical protein
MSFYTMAFFGTVPIGSLIGGVVADRVGASMTVGLSGVVTFFAAIWFASRLPAIRAVVRPIYQERGIITVPAVDAGRKDSLDLAPGSSEHEIDRAEKDTPLPTGS